jgi:ATP-dependent DNA helicase DinG
LKIVEEHLEMIQLALALFKQSDQLIAWVTEETDGLTLVIMPRLVKEVLNERVFSQKMPIVFSSATLSIDGSFDYVADNLGIESYLSFSVPSPHDYENQMKFIAPRLNTQYTIDDKMKLAVRLLQQTDGRALILFPSKEEMRQFKQDILHYEVCKDMRIWFEGDQEISYLISAFQNDEFSVLCAVTLWEGLDIPGPSLSNVIIWSLPFPPNDPVFSARRKASSSSFEEVDLPYMLLRLRQGMGRLIRSKDDRGLVAILSLELYENDVVRKKVQEILPSGVEWNETF